MQAQDLQRIIADLIDKFQNDLDTERRRATAEMEELLYAFCCPPLSLSVCVSPFYRLSVRRVCI